MRFCFISDVHFPFHHKQAWPLTLKILPKLNLDLIFLGGDLFDLEQLSRFSVPPDRMMTLRYDIEKAHRELVRLREIMPNVIIEMQSGNHEARYEKFLYTKGPQIVGLKGHSVQEAFQLDDFDIQYHLPHQGYRRVGKLLLIHGDEVRVGSVDIARKLYLKINENVMCGHYHAEDSYIHTSGVNKKNEGAWVASCLRTLRPDWAPFSQWTLGFILVDVSIGGFFHVDQILYLKRGGRLWTKVDNVEYWS